MKLNHDVLGFLICMGGIFVGAVVGVELFMLIRLSHDESVVCHTEVAEPWVQEGAFGVRGTKYSLAQQKEDPRVKYSMKGGKLIREERDNLVTRYSCESGSLQLNSLDGSPFHFNICGKEGILPGGYFVDIDNDGKVVGGPSKISP